MDPRKLILMVEEMSTEPAYAPPPPVEAPNVAEPSPEPPMAARFVCGDEAMSWYNGWLKTIEPPVPPLHVEYGWDPVYKWYDWEDRPIYWLRRRDGWRGESRRGV